MTRYPSDDKDVAFPAKKHQGSDEEPPESQEFRREVVRDTGERAQREAESDGFGGVFGRSAENKERASDGSDGRSLLDEGRDFVRRTLERRDPEPARRTLRSQVRCAEIMTREIATATKETPLEEVARMMRDEDTGIIPVVHAGQLVGVITDRDIVIRTLAEGRDALSMRAEEAMSGTLHTADPDDRVIDVIKKMGDKQVRRIPVVDEKGMLQGIISMADVALETEEDRELAEALEEISSGASFWSKIVG